MLTVLSAAAFAGLAAAVMAGLAWLGRRVRRRGSAAGDAFVGPFEEMWHPAAHRARRETEIVEERMLSAPQADDQRRPPGR
jgi:hypothetical protein